MSRRALVVHASNLLERGFLSTSTDRQSPSGEPTNALYALTGALDRGLGFKEPELAVAVVDQRDADKAWSPALRKQADKMAEILKAHGFPIVVSANPADFVAAFTANARAAGCDVVIIGSDKRLAQLVADDVWWYDPYKDVRYTPELVRKRFDVDPEVVAGWLAMVGDDDTLPGIKGLGKKGVTGLIADHGSVANAIENAEDIGGRAGKALRASLEEARVELGRAKLDAAVPLETAVEKLIYRTPPLEQLQKLYAELGFFEYLVSDGQSNIEVTVCDSPEAAKGAISSFDRRPVSMHSLYEEPSAVRGKLAGLALTQGDAVFYFPFAAKNGAVVAPSTLTDFLGDASKAKVGHDTKEVTVTFGRLGIEVRGIVFDSCCASHLGEPSNRAPHDLGTVARQVLHRAIPDIDEVRGVGRGRKRWGQISVQKAADYAGVQAMAALDACEAMRAQTSAELMSEYLALAGTLVGMEQNGIACDGDDLLAAGDDFTRIGAELETQIYEHAGKTFNLGSTKQLGTVLFDDLKLTVVKKTKTGWSTATEALERISHSHPIVNLVIRWRLVKRLKDSWVTSLRKAIDGDGRVRSTVHHARSFSGRLVNQAPDLGRVPGRTPEMQRIRHAFAVPAGKVLLSVDYNQLGLFVLAHLTGDPALMEPLSNNGDLHTLTASAVLDLPAEKVGEDERQIGKLINFATFAGQGASSTAMQLGVSAQEAKELIARFDARYAVVRQFQDEQLRLAKKRGYIETIAGRPWPIGGLNSNDQMVRAYAERLARRATHEGSVADVSRRGLLRADEALVGAGLESFPLLQIHDEVLFEVPESELETAAKLAADAMANAFALRVPLRVGCKAGPNWAELEPLESL